MMLLGRMISLRHWDSAHQDTTPVFYPHRGLFRKTCGPPIIYQHLRNPPSDASSSSVPASHSWSYNHTMRCFESVPFTVRDKDIIATAHTRFQVQRTSGKGKKDRGNIYTRVLLLPNNASIHGALKAKKGVSGREDVAGLLQQAYL